MQLCRPEESEAGASSLWAPVGEGRNVRFRSKSRPFGSALGLVWSGWVGFGLVRPHEARPLFDRAFGGVQETSELQLWAGTVASRQLQIIAS